jgi:hypothetical protein
MSMPGFSAVVSAYRTSNVYRAAYGSFAENASPKAILSAISLPNPLERLRHAFCVSSCLNDCFGAHFPPVLFPEVDVGHHCHQMCHDQCTPGPDCPAGTSRCGDQCCPSGSKCCNGACCAAGETCCNGHCCKTCCNDICCYEHQSCVQCPGGPPRCFPNDRDGNPPVCCARPPGWYFCAFGQFCCATNETGCADLGHPCPP